MRILFLDDDEWRHTRFGQRKRGLAIVTHVRTVDEVVKAITEADKPFHEVWLDHDLGIFTEEGEVTGMAAVTFIVGLPINKRPLRVYVHSLNDVAAHRMILVLKDAGIFCQRRGVW